MNLNCAPACSTCDSLDIRHRCPIEPGNESIWKAGDLNELMERIVDDADGSGEYKRYNPTALSRPKLRRDGTPAPGVEEDGPWVVVLENFVSSEEADRLGFESVWLPEHLVFPVTIHGSPRDGEEHPPVPPNAD